jgi:hypothetical protein
LEKRESGEGTVRVFNLKPPKKNAALENKIRQPREDVRRLSQMLCL